MRCLVWHVTIKSMTSSHAPPPPPPIPNNEMGWGGLIKGVGNCSLTHQPIHPRPPPPKKKKKKKRKEHTGKKHKKKYCILAETLVT